MSEPTNLNPQQTEQFAQLLQAYREIFSMAANLSNLAPDHLRVAAFQETLRHMFEQERLVMLSQMSQASAPQSPIITFPNSSRH